MLKVIGLSLLAIIAFADHNPQSVVHNHVTKCRWEDFVFCDHDEWEFENPDPAVHAIHRDGGEHPLIDTCLYGEFSNGPLGNVNARSNRWSFTYLDVKHTDDPNENDEHTYSRYDSAVFANIEARMFAYCDWENDETLEVYVFDQYTGAFDDADQKLDRTNYDRNRQIFIKGKRDGSCSSGDSLFDWEGGDINSPPSDIPCLNGDSNCYQDIDSTWELEGGCIGLLFITNMDDSIDEVAYAFGNLAIDICPPPVDTCCTGTHSNPNKLCEDLHEVRNCEAKGCTWANHDMCQLDCCRKVDPATKVKGPTSPKCKNTNYLLPSVCNRRDDCLISDCDWIGQMDGILNL